MLDTHATATSAPPGVSPVGGGETSGTGSSPSATVSPTSGGTPGTTPSGATTTTTARGATTTTGPTGPKCPNPKTCDIYRLIDTGSGTGGTPTKGWRPDADGTVRIPYYVNPTPPQGSGLTEDTIEAAIVEGTRIIEAANPRIKFVYRGRTTRIPRELDGYNDFAYGGLAFVHHDSSGHIDEADIRSRQYVTAGPGAYTPCEQRDGGCGNSGTGKGEILTTIVHEEVHTLGLADLSGAETTELTMDGEPDGLGERSKVTLGLGDVLGIRALYPTSAPMPPIYAP